jgi:hypothetical protein
MHVCKVILAYTSALNNFNYMLSVHFTLFTVITVRMAYNVLRLFYAIYSHKVAYNEYI